MKKAIKVLQRDPDITNTAFGEDELDQELRLESLNKARDQRSGGVKGMPDRDGGYNQSQSDFNRGPGPNNMNVPPQNMPAR